MAQDSVIDRFTDADKEPTKTLVHIVGYEKMPLVSLKEAVASIKTPIHNLETMVWTAERNSEDPSDGLTPDESACIHLYTMEWPKGHDSFYKLLNEKLRSEKRNELESWFSYLKLFFTALYKLPSLRKVIWRGIRGNVSHLYKKDFIWWGVSSCTDTMDVMQKFVGRSGVRTIFMIECIHGKAIKSHSHYKTENEIILMPGTYLRVINKWSPSDDLYMIQLQEETPPHQLMASPFTSSSSSVDTISLNKLTTSETSQPDYQVSSFDSLSSVGTPPLNKSSISNTSEPDYQVSPFNSLSSVGTPPLNRSSISNISQPDYQAASIQSDKPKPTTNLLSSPPIYKNPKLEQKINENKNTSSLRFSWENLTDADMEIIGYYLLRNNKVSNVISLLKRRDECRYN